MPKRKSYTAEFKLQMVKYAAEHGNRAAERQFGVSEKIVRDWRRAEATLGEMRKTKRANRGLKARWPELEGKVREWALEQRAAGRAPSTAQFRLRAQAIAREMNIDDFAGGRSWCYRFMQRSRLSIRARVCPTRPPDVRAQTAGFRAFVEKEIAAHDVSPDHIVNMGEVPFALEVPTSRGVARKGRRSASVATTGREKLRFTAVLACCGDGRKLPPMVIFKRKTLPKDAFPPSVVVTTNAKGRMDEETASSWLAKCYAKRPDGLSKTRRALLLVGGGTRTRVTARVQDQIRACNSIPVLPGGSTKSPLPLDITVGRSFKAALRRLWERWVVDGERSYAETGRMCHATFKDVVGWIDGAWAAVTTDSVLSGFQKAGLIGTDAVTGMDTPPHLPWELHSDTEGGEFSRLGDADEKTFTPNIIGRKAKEELKVESGYRRERKDGERGGRGQRDRGRGRGRPEIIQSHSIFEQGPSEASMKKRGAYESERDAPAVGPSPIINIKKEKRETEEETKEILRKLERENFIDDPYLKSEERSCPVQLPLAVSGWGFKEEFSEPFPKIEKVEEDTDVMEPTVKVCVKNLNSNVLSVSPTMVKMPIRIMYPDSMVQIDKSSQISVKQEPIEAEIKKVEMNFKPPPLPDPENLPDLLDRWSLSKDEELIFMQLPDSLPGQPPTREVRVVKTEVQPEDGQSMLLKSESQVDAFSIGYKCQNIFEEEPAEENSCHLNDLQEGLVGKMLVRKSGRVQLILGHIILDVSLGTPCAFLQELVSVGTQGRVGDMTVLGHIKHKMVCSPDFEALLEGRT